MQDRFWKQIGFPSSVAFCYSAQVAVSSCGQGSRMRSFYTLSETGSGGEVWKFRFVTHGYRVFYKKIMAGRIFFDIYNLYWYTYTYVQYNAKEYNFNSCKIYTAMSNSK